MKSFSRFIPFLPTRALYGTFALGSFSLFSSSSSTSHYVRQEASLYPPYPDGMEVMVFAAGCFWGTEKGFWRLPGVYSTSVGYVGGEKENPTYEEVCSGSTGHTEATQVVWDPSKVSASDLLRYFWACHDPTQGDGQGNDRGSQYRSGLFCSDADQLSLAKSSAQAYQKALQEKGYGPITTEIKALSPEGTPGQYWFAEDYHQQYLAKPGSRQYCSAQPTAVTLPPFEEWPALSDAVRERFEPKLPPAFWSAFDGSIRTPNAPVEWEVDLNEGGERLDPSEAIKDLIHSYVQSSEVTIFSKSYCGFCRRAKQQFEDLGIKYTAIELDQREDGGAIQAALFEETDISTVPIVYVKGKLLGDSGATVKARQEGHFKALQDAGEL